MHCLPKINKISQEQRSLSRTGDIQEGSIDLSVSVTCITKLKTPIISILITAVLDIIKQRMVGLMLVTRL